MEMEKGRKWVIHLYQFTLQNSEPPPFIPLFHVSLHLYNCVPLCSFLTLFLLLSAVSGFFFHITPCSFYLCYLNLFLCISFILPFLCHFCQPTVSFPSLLLLSTSHLYSLLPLSAVSLLSFPCVFQLLYSQFYHSFLSVSLPLTSFYSPKNAPSLFFASFLSSSVSLTFSLSLSPALSLGVIAPLLEPGNRND